MARLLNIQKKRRRQNKTDYKSRFSLLKSGKSRIIIRKTNKYLLIQAVASIESQDKVIAGITSKALINYGWGEKYIGSLKSIPACYLTGLLFAHTQKDSKTKNILDIGLSRSIGGSRIYSAVNGLIDGGMNIEADKKIFPKKEKLEGKNVKKELAGIIKKVQANILGGTKK